jgi:hypothetical protein
VKVRELIEKLQQLPEDDAVGVFDRFEDTCHCGCGTTDTGHEYVSDVDLDSWGTGRWVLRS